MSHSSVSVRRGSPSGKSMEVQRSPISAACDTLSKVMQKTPLSIDRTDNRLKHTNDVLQDMREFAERLKTFENWPVSFLKPEKLAQDGFYYLNRGDEVRCAFCKVEIMKWEPGDDPAVDHRKWAPQCPFLQQRASGSDSQTADGRDECGPANLMPPRSSPISGSVPLTGAAYPEYSILSSRLATFKHWPLSLRQKPKDLADAGFFYTGQGDQTKCFYCGGGLKDWEDDDVPWEQHARWFDRCSYVRLAKGREYIQKVMTEASMIPSTSVKKEAAKEEVSAEVPPIESVTNAEVKDENICKICYVEERNVCFVPCGHVVACAKCALTTYKCPVCRKTFTDVVRMYFA